MSPDWLIINQSASNLKVLQFKPSIGLYYIIRSNETVQLQLYIYS